MKILHLPQHSYELLVAKLKHLLNNFMLTLPLPDSRLRGRSRPRGGLLAILWSGSDGIILMIDGLRLGLLAPEQHAQFAA